MDETWLGVERGRERERLDCVRERERGRERERERERERDDEKKEEEEKKKDLHQLVKKFLNILIITILSTCSKKTSICHLGNTIEVIKPKKTSVGSERVSHHHNTVFVLDSQNSTSRDDRVAKEKERKGRLRERERDVLMRRCGCVEGGEKERERQVEK